MTQYPEPIVRFHGYVDVDDNGCWNWTGQRKSSGYGKFFAYGKHHNAHRWGYEFLVGPIPEGLQLDHLCRNRACVNPDHLEPVTNGENQIRRYVAARLEGPVFCKSGRHEMTDQNSHTDSRGKTRCRACNNEANSARDKAKRLSLVMR
jgi:hypothetical protein